MADDLDRALAGSTYKHYKPLRDAVDEYVHWAQNPSERVYIGIPQLDDAMRGTAKRQMAGIVGYTHSGKTLLATHMALHNPDSGIVMFEPDESRMGMAVKITAARTGISARELEAQLLDEDMQRFAKAALYETAENLPNLFICEENLFPDEMYTACLEFEQARQVPVRAVVFDYARLLKVEGDERAKLECLKHWTNDHAMSTFVLHQTSRGSGRDGAPITIESGMIGGEDVFTFMIGVRRKYKFHESIARDLEAALAKELDPKKRMIIQEALEEQYIEVENHRDSITLNLVKNKVPPNDLVADFDLTIDRSCGRLLPGPRKALAREMWT